MALSLCFWLALMVACHTYRFSSHNSRKLWHFRCPGCGRYKRGRQTGLNRYGTPFRPSVNVLLGNGDRTFGLPTARRDLQIIQLSHVAGYSKGFEVFDEAIPAWPWVKTANQDVLSYFVAIPASIAEVLWGGFLVSTISSSTCRCRLKASDSENVVRYHDSRDPTRCGSDKE
jgi:hypothetical protein